MSLKAKIEAVIYASEEPVTLAQLAGLLGEEAQAELDAKAAEQQTLALEDEEQQGEQAAQDDAEATPEAETPVVPATGDDERAAEDVTPVEATEENVAAAQEAVATTKAEQEKVIAAEAKARERRLRGYFRELVDQLIADYANGDRGLEVREVAGGFRLATKPEYHDAVRGFVKQLKPPLKLSLQALETLAVVAYKQPVTAPEVGEIRGVDSAGVLGSLMARKLVTTAGRKQVIGRPILYKTTKEFLVRFGLKDLNELPSIEEFEKMAGELNDAIQEEIPMEETAARNSEEENEEPTDAAERGEEVDGVADVNPADNIVVDGRIVGGPHADREEDARGEEEDEVDTPAIDAEVQGGSEDGEA